MNASRIGLFLVCFALVCFLTALFFNTSKGDAILLSLSSEELQQTTLTKTFPIADENAVYEIYVSQSIEELNANKGSSFIGIEIKDDKGKTFVSFGDDFWKASGRDSDGYWSEQKSNYSMKVTFPYPGTYTLAVENSVEGTSQKITSPVKVSLQQKRGSSLPFVIMGVAAFILGATLSFFSSSKKSRVSSIASGAANLIDI